MRAVRFASAKAGLFATFVLRRVLYLARAKEEHFAAVVPHIHFRCVTV